MHRRACAVPRYIDEVQRIAAVAKAVIAECVTAELRRWKEGPLRDHGSSGPERRQQRLNVMRGPLQVAVEFERSLDLLARPEFVAKNLIADLQDASDGQHDRALYTLAVDERAVGRVEVGHDDEPEAVLDAAVTARKAGVMDDHFARLGAADMHGGLGEANPASRLLAFDENHIVDAIVRGRRLLAAYQYRVI